MAEHTPGPWSGLRAAVEALAQQCVDEAAKTHDDTVGGFGEELRAILAAHPEKEAEQKVEGAKVEPVAWFCRANVANGSPFTEWFAEHPLPSCYPREMWTPLYASPPPAIPADRWQEGMRAALARYPHAADAITWINSALGPLGEITPEHLLAAAPQPESKP